MVLNKRGVLLRGNNVKGMEMTAAQREVYLVIDEWWKKFGFGPSVDDVMFVLKVKGRGNTARKMRKLVELGYCKGGGKARSIRPAYLKTREII